MSLQAIQTPELEPRYMLVDDIAPVAAERQVLRDQAWALIERRRQLKANKQEAFVPLTIDPLSTAEKVIFAKKEYNEGSPEYLEKLRGLQKDCARLFAEWWRKKRPEYFEPLVHDYDPETEDHFSHGLSIRQMTENALTPIDDDPEEESRRVNEFVENATPQIVRKRGGFMLGLVGIRTFSECTDKAIRDYEYDQAAGASHSGYKGYVPEIQKLMIRDQWIDPESGDRYEEQVGLPGIYINHDTIQRALVRRGINAKHMDKTQLHGAQMMVDDDLIELVELLDTVASEQWCVDIFMGEKVEPGFTKNYGAIREEAKQRQAEQAQYVDMLVDYVLGLAEDGLDKKRALVKIEEFTKRLLLSEAKRRPAVAEQIFDHNTARGLKEVTDLEARGLYQEAARRFEQVQEQAPGGGYCGSGSCGLEAVSPGSDEAEAVTKTTGTKSTADMIKDTERKCPDCKSKTIVYDVKARKKICTNQECKATKSY